MLKPRCLAGLAVSCLTLAAFAAGPPVESAEARAARLLIDGMADRDWAARDKAERRIVAMGFDAIPLLRRAIGHPDPEVRRRARRLLPPLEHAALMRPQRYTFSIVNQPFKGVVEGMKKATGYKIEDNSGVAFPLPAAGLGRLFPPGEKKFTYHFKDATWWEIMDRVSLDTGVYPQLNWGDDTLRLYQNAAEAKHPHSGYDGGHRYTASGFQLVRHVDLARAGAVGGGRTESLTLNLTLYAEPRRPFLGVEEARLEVAKDDKKGSMLPAPTPNDLDGGGGPFGGRMVSRRYSSGGYKQMSVQASVTLGSPTDGARRLALVKGVVPVTLLLEQKPIVVTDEVGKAKGLRKEMEGVEFHIQESKALENGQWQVQFAVTNKANPGDYNMLNTIYQRVELLDAKGTKYQNYGSSWGGGAGGSMQLTLTFGHFGGAGAKIGPPTRLVYHHWVTKTHDLAFEFKDLPLP